MPPGMNTSRASASVIAAGVVAIIGSAFAILSCGFTLLGMALISSTPTDHPLPAQVKSITSIAILIFLAVAVFGVTCGVGILRLKNWARISAMVWAGIAVFFSSFAFLIIAFIPFPRPPGEHPFPQSAVRGLVALFYAIPIAIGIWWLILFNKRSIRSQFNGEAPAETAEMSSKPRCPLPVAVIAGFLIFSFFSALLAPLFRFPVPVVLFGHLINGKLGVAFFVLADILMLIAAAGLWRLQRWSYPLLIGLQSFWLLSGTITMLSPSYERNMQEMFNEMQMPQTNVDLISRMLHNPWFTMVALLPSIVILIILLYYRTDFQLAAEQAKRSQTA
jgi:hypothetical protein